eukprot:COSAG02_NODE_35492_length_467_cov_1.211957_1_plen_27_part_01
MIFRCAHALFQTLEEKVTLLHGGKKPG